MSKYKISYGMDGRACNKTIEAESEGEAIEWFENFIEGYDNDFELIGIKELVDD